MDAKKIKDNTWMLRLDKGENIPDAIIEFCSENKINTAFIKGIGAVKRITLAFFAIDEKAYKETKYLEHHELVSLTGNVVTKEDKLYLHAHAVIGNEDNLIRGGHLVSAEVSETAEIILLGFEDNIERLPDDKTGLFLWKL